MSSFGAKWFCPLSLSHSLLSMTNSPLRLIRSLFRRSVFHSHLESAVLECHVFLLHLLLALGRELARPEEDLIADESERSHHHKQDE